MLTQLELLSATGGLSVEDENMSVSPLDDLAEYAMKHTDFEYFETGLSNDSYYGISQKHESFPASTAPTTVLTATVYDPASYDNAIVLYDHYMEPLEAEKKTFVDDMKSHDFEKTLCDEDGQPILNELGFEDDASSNDCFSGSAYSISTEDSQAISFDFGSTPDSLNQDVNITEAKQLSTEKSWDEGNTKGKIGPLQRRALDDIFSVTDKPSRGLVLHIASELGLHHLTVKNFFSNARRRLRRAAARLSDPERTKRENERRKEKRRLAALASATMASVEGRGSVSLTNTSKAPTPRTPPADSPPPKETVVSPERRALMEKLADKVQRSVAQRTLAADLELLRGASCHGHTKQSQKIFSVHPPQEILIPPSSDILSHASPDILAESARELLGPSDDFLPQPSHALDTDPSSASALLHCQNEHWSLF
ncbi:uncharacterized protein LOC119578945 [Penaeus monodon]|uniref:uncharacterized protein LOC119578945 n=1 Tax=Penaeus monodon TaxID=6687 RepID=UPI0018A6F7B9|nr:uncharacterized protein LOC119578945 [Penaeus monodon]